MLDANKKKINLDEKVYVKRKVDEEVRIDRGTVTMISHARMQVQVQIPGYSIPLWFNPNDLAITL